MLMKVGSKNGWDEGWMLCEFYEGGSKKGQGEGWNNVDPGSVKL